MIQSVLHGVPKGMTLYRKVDTYSNIALETVEVSNGHEVPGSVTQEMPMVLTVVSIGYADGGVASGAIQVEIYYSTDGTSPGTGAIPPESIIVADIVVSDEVPYGQMVIGTSFVVKDGESVENHFVSPGKFYSRITRYGGSGTNEASVTYMGYYK